MRCLCGLLVALLMIACGFEPCAAQDPIPGVRAAVAPSIVKIRGKGTTAAGREVPFEGSGVVIAAHQEISVVITAAHVVGRKGTWRTKESGDPDREFQVWARRTRSGPLEPLPLPAPDIVAQDDNNDFAILVVRGEFPAAELGNPLQLAQGAQTVIMGYPASSFDLALDDGRAQLVVRNAFGFVLQLSDMQTIGGQSGGPVLDLEGRVLGILSGGLRLATGQDLAIPITTIQPALAPYLPRSPTSTVLDVGGREGTRVEGSVRIEVSGNGGGDFGRSLRGEARLSNDVGIITAQQALKVGDDASIAARGGERSECREDSGRTTSSARASASVIRGADDTLILNVELYAHGGHYRSAATCLAGQPIGLTGHDTLARAAGTVQGSLRIPVLDDRTRSLRILFDGLPQADTLIEVLDPDGVVVSRLQNRSSGEQEVTVTKRGVYLVRLTSHPAVSGEGGSGEQRIQFGARVGFERVMR